MPTAELLPARRGRGPRGGGRPGPEARSVPGLNKEQAERLLDWLEAHGCARREAVWEEGHGFTVHFRPPPWSTAGPAARPGRRSPSGSPSLPPA
jgi:hypothetical protein